MSREGLAAIIIGLGLAGLFFLLDKVVTSMPVIATTCGFIASGVLILLGVLLTWPRSNKTKMLEMARQMESIAAGMQELVSARRQYDPSNVPISHLPGWDSWDEERKNKEWNESTQMALDYNHQTMDIYKGRFHDKVVRLVRKATKLGYTDSKLERFYERPTTSIGIEVVADRLRALANRIRQDRE